MKISPESNPSVVLVLVTQQIWVKMRGNFFRGHPFITGDSGWQLPDRLDLSPWKEFQKIAPEDELLAVIWSQILGLKDEDISTALGFSEGTLRYRMGRALRKLGGVMPVGARRLETVRI
jgi:hypothetical protein